MLSSDCDGISKWIDIAHALAQTKTTTSNVPTVASEYAPILDTALTLRATRIVVGRNNAVIKTRLSRYANGKKLYSSDDTPLNALNGSGKPYAKYPGPSSILSQYGCHHPKGKNSTKMKLNDTAHAKPAAHADFDEDCLDPATLSPSWLA